MERSRYQAAWHVGEVAHNPADCETIEAALELVQGKPVLRGCNRPWIYDRQSGRFIHLNGQAVDHESLWPSRFP